MTDTTTTDPEDTANTEDRAAGTIEHIDPHTLVLDPNVRDEPDVDADFLASIKEHGVLIPIAAVRDANGQVRAKSVAGDYLKVTSGVFPLLYERRTGYTLPVGTRLPLKRLLCAIPEIGTQVDDSGFADRKIPKVSGQATAPGGAGGAGSCCAGVELVQAAGSRVTR